MSRLKNPFFLLFFPKNSILSIMDFFSQILDNETLNIYIHILGKYLNDSPTTSSTTGRTNDLNELVIQKILTLGKEYKQELKQALDKSPPLKTKFSNALRISTSQAAAANSAAAQGNEQRNQASSQLNKAPKIQLNFNFSKK